VLSIEVVTTTKHTNIAMRKRKENEMNKGVKEGRNGGDEFGGRACLSCHFVYI
jgi:hypothetical protein